MEDISLEVARVQRAAAYLKSRLPQADIAIVLGSGLAELANMLEHKTVVEYRDIPDFPQPTVLGHGGQLICGQVGGRTIYAFSGRFHYYEGHDPWTVVRHVRVMGELGCTSLILTNASGGVNTAFSAGDLMLITDHINLMGFNPLRGGNWDPWGLRFPDMSEAYDKQYRELALTVASEQGVTLRQGVYCGLAGPSYETPAEIRMLRTLGADAVGMSTVPETLAARHLGLRVLGISCVTNMAAGVLDQKLTHEEVFATGKQAEQKFSRLLAGIISRM
ncbi:MAG: purine-nucleoside phosphorylase [Firmicutes bacterium]|nr:purine-nucleoside phosphorylase [Bacillota bacterium]